MAKRFEIKCLKNLWNRKYISYSEEKRLWDKFWISKYGYLPTKVDRTFVKKITLNEKFLEKEKLNKEFLEFVLANR